MLFRSPFYFAASFGWLFGTSDGISKDVPESGTWPNKGSPLLTTRNLLFYMDGTAHNRFLWLYLVMEGCFCNVIVLISGRTDCLGLQRRETSFLPAFSVKD